MSALRDFAEALELPPAARRAFLAEVSGDLEAVYGELRSRGLGRTEAWRAAAELVLPDELVLRAMTRLHRPVWVRWAERLTGSAGAVDRALLVMLTAVVLLTTLGALVNGGVLAPVTWALVPVLATGALAAVLVVWWAFLAVVRREARPARLRAGARSVAAAGAGAVAVAVLSAGAGFLRAVRAASGGVVSVEPLLAWIPTGVAQLSLGLVVALQAAVAWLLLTRQAIRFEHDLVGTLARIRGIHFPAAG